MSDTHKLIAIAVMVFIFFAGGIAIGFFKWGFHRETPDYREFLMNTANYLGRLESQNKQLNAELEAFNAAVAAPAKGEDSGEGEVDPVTSHLQAKIATLQQENVALLSALRTDTDLEAINLDLKQQLQAVITARQQLAKENEMLRSADNQSQDLLVEHQDLQGQLESVTKAKAALEQENTELRSTIGQQENLETENQQLSAQMQQCSDVRQNLENRISELQSDINKYNDLLSENLRLKTELDANAKEISYLKSRLEEIRAVAVGEEKLN
jgi:DNA repair exonuclease SbcCD ATPase subunit